jgi:hypothetical protein
MNDALLNRSTRRTTCLVMALAYFSLALCAALDIVLFIYLAFLWFRFLLLGFAVSLATPCAGDGPA